MSVTGRRYLYVVYPQNGHLTNKQVEDWYTDAVNKGAISDKFLNANDLITMAYALEDAGLISFPRTGVTEQDDQNPSD